MAEVITFKKVNAELNGRKIFFPIVDAKNAKRACERLGMRFISVEA